MKTKGFSIVELIIAIGVIVIVSAVIFPGYRSYSRSLFLDGEVNSFVKSIESVRSMAIATKEVPIDTDAIDGFVGIKGREYGIKIDKDSYEIFVITVVLTEDLLTQEQEDVKTVMQRVNLTRDVVFSDEGASVEEEIEIRFSPPDPDVNFLKGGEGVSDERLEIEMGYKDIGPQVRIIINQLGVVKRDSI